MSTSQTGDPADARAQREALIWMSRIDRGLTPVEQDEFFAWLARSPTHGEYLNRCRQRWRRLDRLADWRPEHSLAPNPDLLAPRPRQRWRRWSVPALLSAVGQARVRPFGIRSSLQIWLAATSLKHSQWHLHSRVGHKLRIQYLGALQ